MQTKQRSDAKRQRKTTNSHLSVSESGQAKPSRKRLWSLLFVLVVLISLGWASREILANRLAKSAGNLSHLYDRQRVDLLLSVAGLLSPEVPQIALTRARWERRRGDLQDSLAYFDKALEQGAEESDLYLEQSLFAAQRQPDPKTDKRLISLLEEYPAHRADICFAYVLGYISYRRYDPALLLLEGWIEEDPAAALPKALLGTVYAEQDKGTEAEAQYRKALNLEPTNPLAAFGLAELLAKEGNIKEAIPFYQIASQIEFSGSVPAIIGWAASLRSVGESDQAQVILDNALVVRPHEPDILLERANLALENGDFQLAADLLQPQIDRGARQQAVNYAYATAQRRLGNVEVAKTHFEFAAEAAKEANTIVRLDTQLAEQPDNNDLRFEIGWRHLRYGDPNEGLMWLSQVLENNPDHKQTHQVLAEYYENLSRQQKDADKLAKMHRRKLASLQ